MAKLRSSLTLILTLSGCAAQVPPSATADPALAEKVRTQMGNNECSGRVANALSAYHLTAGGISSIELAPATPGYPTEYSLALRQVWVRQSAQPGAIVVTYDPRGCRVATVQARDGATLPAV